MNLQNRSILRTFRRFEPTDYNGRICCPMRHTRGQVCDQLLQLGVTVQVIVFGQVAPEGTDDGSSLL